MSDQDRLSALCKLGDGLVPSLTGIDFIQVVDPEDQRVLRVFFIVDPRRVRLSEEDESLAPEVLPAELDLVAGPIDIRINSVSGGVEVEVESAAWVEHDDRTALEVTVAAPGDFSIYRFGILDQAPGVDPPPSRIDPFFNDAEFSFKQGCPSVLDCRERDPECPPDELVDFPIDYLARDFTSLQSALLDFAAQRYPEWSERIEADGGVMLAEVMAALGDEFSYIQDRYAREAYLDTATQRRSLRWHSRLVDYDIDNGRSATTQLALRVGELSGDYVPAGTRVWAAGNENALVPFEIGDGLTDRRRFWIQPEWDEIEAHVPDSSNPCLPAGSTELFLVGHFPTPNGALPIVADEEFDDDGDWIGRLVILKATPEDPSQPERRHIVRIRSVTQGTDQVCRTDGNNPIDYTRITWDESEALPFELFLPTTSVCANVVPATAGETFEETFAIGTGEVAASPELLAAVERQGPCNELTGERTPTFLFSLTETESRGMGWLMRDGRAAPELDLSEDPTSAAPDNWFYQRSLLDSTGRDPHVTLDHGSWRTIFRVQRFGKLIEHSDYASDNGFTIRFGDGEFGRRPAPGTVFRARYRTDVGTVGNVPSDTITIIQDPNPSVGDPAPTLTDLAQRVTNPLPVTTGVDPQPIEVIKHLAPEAFKAETFRAVRDEDYREHAERVDGVQQAGARARWTGSWLTEFVTADPQGSFQTSDELRRRIANRLDCVRQVGREVVVKDPKYLNVDLEIEICVESFAYPGQVQQAVVRALTMTTRRGARVELPFFHPDNFTFGVPLRRADLEAAVQAVPGVRGVLQIWIRIRGVTGRRLFSELVFAIADDRILRLQNDPRFPDRGSLKVVVV